MDTITLEPLLRLYSIPGIGPTRMRKLISEFQSPRLVLEAGIEQLIRVEGIDQKTAQKITAGADEDFVQKQLQMLAKHDTKLITYWDAEYPARLKKIYDPPVFLFYKGNLEILNLPSIAVVGTRNPTGYGRMVTEKISRELAEKGLAIISGLARGVDTLAHKTALKNNARTIAVLGNGLDVIYPPENKKLYEDIIENGIIVSEYAMGTKPDAVNFPKRNRIISALSLGVVVTEAGDKSGALLTALYANDQNREVFAVPGSIVSLQSRGTNKLVRNGAKLTRDVYDILEELEGQLELDLSADKKAEPEPELTGSALKIYQLLSSEPLHIDQIAVDAELGVPETLSVLLLLELKGCIRQLAGKMFVRR